MNRKYQSEYPITNLTREKYVMPSKPVPKEVIYAMTFASVYPHYLARVEKNGRTKEELDKIIHWLTGYTPKKLEKVIQQKIDFETFYKSAPKMNPNRKLIKGVVCGKRVEEIKDKIIRDIRYLDKLVDELARGKKMNSILRTKKPYIYTEAFGNVYPLYLAKVEKKGHTKQELDEIIHWLTGYTPKKVEKAIEKKIDFETFFNKAPKMNPNRKLIKGVVCGKRVEEIKEKLMRDIRYLDKLIDELLRGKKMESILRTKK